MKVTMHPDSLDDVYQLARGIHDWITAQPDMECRATSPRSCVVLADALDPQLAVDPRMLCATCFLRTLAARLEQQILHTINGRFLAGAAPPKSPPS